MMGPVLGTAVVVGVGMFGPLVAAPLANAAINESDGISSGERAIAIASIYGPPALAGWIVSGSPLKGAIIGGAGYAIDRFMPGGLAVRFVAQVALIYVVLR